MQCFDAEEDAEVVELEHAAVCLAIVRRPRGAHDAARRADFELKLDTVDELRAAHRVVSL